MAINIEMPKLSDTMTEGTLLKWHKQVGDEVEIGDIIAEVETDKANMEVEAFDEGTITSILINEGEKAPIGGVLAVLDGDGADSAPAAAAPAAEEAPAAEAAPAETPASTPAPAPAAASDGSRIKSSPLARKLAAEKGVDLSTLTGTGPGGRIVSADVEGAGSSQPSQAATAAAGLAAAVKARSTGGAAPAPAPAKAVTATAGQGDQTIPLSSMRKIIAERLLTSKQTIPHFYLHVEVDVAPLLELRKQINAQAEQTHGNKYSVNDFVLKAAINAAQAVPAVNASFNGDSIIQFEHVGMAVAIAVEDGLVTPVIKEAETKSLLQISREVKDMAARAREKKLKPNEFDGGTLTVSNLGAWGVESFDAIVNPPQSLILSIGAASEKPVVKDGQIVPGLRMNVGVSCDHRVVDGAVGAEFLAEFKKLLEQPALMLI
ncbi:MAG: pyruvate dehydrogenase complex dihydrolipoamide acetyltransferase [Verrucomicrobiota bacterium]